MNERILDPEFQPLRIKLEEIVKQQHEMAVSTHDEFLVKVISELRNTLHEPFLFVIVGEVKTGKSSFINALLATGTEVVKVAPDPCTDTVQQVIYGETPQEIVVNPYLKKIVQPAEILQYISVVDTPGTNTISEQHQEITEGYIPRADLIVFVFEAKNPYRQSAWDFFNYIHEDWQKKVIFVLQQSDLMEEDDLKVNLKGVTDYAVKKGMQGPQVFAVSAKKELQGDRKASNFEPLIEYIRENITGKNAFKLKLQSNISISRNLQDRIYGKLEKMEDQLKADREFRSDVIHTLQDQEERSKRQIDALSQQLLSDYDSATSKARRELSDGLGFFSLTKKSVLSIFSRSDSPKSWLEKLTETLKLELDRNFTHRLNDGVEEIADSIAQMARIIDLKIQNSQTVLTDRQEVFGEISDRRRIVLRDLRDGFEQFMQQTEHFVGEEVFPEAAKVSPNLAAGSGVAVIGAVLTAATTVPALDITGGILSALGVLFAGGTVMAKRGKIIQGFSQEIARGREQLKSELDLKLKSYVSHIRSKIDGNFVEFDALLKLETEQIERLAQQHTDIGGQLDELGKIIGEGE